MNAKKKRLLSLLLTLVLLLCCLPYAAPAAQAAAEQTPQPLGQENPFVDVAPGKYYYTPVLWAYYHDPQITGGTDSTHFSPGRNCTREQIVNFLWKYKGAPAPNMTNNPFTDVKPGKYYYKAVLWAVENGVATGTGNASFGVGKPCTRAQAMTFLWKAHGAPEPTDTYNSFTDVKPGKYYYKAVLWAIQNCVTSGVSDTTFGVSKTCTRGQIVTFLYNAKDALKIVKDLTLSDTNKLTISVSGGKGKLTYYLMKWSESDWWVQEGTSSDARNCRFNVQQSGTYMVCVEDEVGRWQNSSPVTVTFPKLSITKQPDDLFLEASSSYTGTLSVECSGGVPPYSYQWQKQAVDSTEWVNYSSGQNAAVDGRTQGKFRCIVTDRMGQEQTSREAVVDPKLKIENVSANLYTSFSTVINGKYVFEFTGGTSQFYAKFTRRYGSVTGDYPNADYSIVRLANNNLAVVLIAPHKELVNDRWVPYGYQCTLFDHFGQSLSFPMTWVQD